MLAFTAGVVLGPVALDVLDPRDWGEADTLLREVARLTLAIGLMATALRLPPRYFQEQWRTQARLIGVLMPAMWGVSALLAYAWLDVPPAAALLIGAIVTPTDPIVASSIVTSVGVGLALAILALRRLPALLMLGPWLPALRGRADAAFLGWFGPIGVSALLYVTDALHRTGQESIWPVVSLIVAASIVAHGVTATPFTRMYGDRTG